MKPRFRQARESLEAWVREAKGSAAGIPGLLNKKRRLGDRTGGARNYNRYYVCHAGGDTDKIL